VPKELVRGKRSLAAGSTDLPTDANLRYIFGYGRSAIRTSQHRNGHPLTAHRTRGCRFSARGRPLYPHAEVQGLGPATDERVGGEGARRRSISGRRTRVGELPACGPSACVAPVEGARFAEATGNFVEALQHFGQIDPGASASTCRRRL